MLLALRDRILASPGGSSRPLTPDEMRSLASEVVLDDLDLGDYCKFSETCYARNTVFVNEHVELVVICWLQGQASAVHDHGKSNCLYLVTEGEMREDLFQLKPEGKPKRATTRRFKRGDITIAASTDIHRILNDRDSNLVTIHIYSPPLDETMTLYTPIPNRGVITE